MLQLNLELRLEGEVSRRVRAPERELALGNVPLLPDHVPHGQILLAQRELDDALLAGAQEDLVEAAEMTRGLVLLALGVRHVLESASSAGGDWV